MSERLRTYVSAISLVLLILSIGAADIGHKHFLPDARSSCHRLYSHDCTSKELHKPIAAEKQCVLCQRVAQNVSVLSVFTNAAEVSKSPLPAPVHIVVRSENVFLTFTKRGPPPFIA